MPIGHRLGVGKQKERESGNRGIGGPLGDDKEREEEEEKGGIDQIEETEIVSMRLKKRKGIWRGARGKRKVFLFLRSQIISNAKLLIFWGKLSSDAS